MKNVLTRNRNLAKLSRKELCQKTLENNSEG